MTSVSRFIVKAIFLWAGLGAYFVFILDACKPEAPYFTEGRSYLHKGKYAKATKKFERYLKKYPEGPERIRAKFLLAKAHMGQGDYDDAKKGFNGLIKKHDTSPEKIKSIFKLALIQLTSGQKLSALVYIARIDTGAARPNSLRGEALAMKHWLTGGTTKPHPLAGTMRKNRLLEPKRGGQLVKTGLFENALPYLAKRSGAKARLFLGKAWLGLHDFEQAHKVFSACAKRFPKTKIGDKCRFKAAMSLLFMNKRVAARSAFTKIRSGVMLPETDVMKRWLGQ
jgi:tetratricopeptide (TPR) repeat protein